MFASVTPATVSSIELYLDCVSLFVDVFFSSVLKNFNYIVDSLEWVAEVVRRDYTARLKFRRAGWVHLIAIRRLQNEKNRFFMF